MSNMTTDIKNDVVQHPCLIKRNKKVYLYYGCDKCKSTNAVKYEGQEAKYHCQFCDTSKELKEEPKFKEKVNYGY